MDFNLQELYKLCQSILVFWLTFGVIGFIDDFAKVAKKQNEDFRFLYRLIDITANIFCANLLIESGFCQYTVYGKMNA